MGNIITADQGLLPLPIYGAAVATPYPWWLAAALAIWALLALLCCWLLLLLCLLRYCCKWWRQRRYAADRKSLRSRLFGAGGAAKGPQTPYGAADPRNPFGALGSHFSSAPLPPVPPYAVNNGMDNIYGDPVPYVAAGAFGGRSGALESGSESFSDEDNRNRGVTENVETNIQRNITKNFYINEEQNYYIQKEPIVQASQILHEQEIQRLPAPTVTTVNMAAERIADNPSWENAKPKEDLDIQRPKQASSEIVRSDPSLFNQDVTYESQPNIYTHRPVTPEIPLIESRVLGARTTNISDSGSITSEMSGHDSESIYETIRVLTPKKQTLPPLEDEDEYKTAGIDELEIEIKDLVRLQKANGRSGGGGGSYDDILSSTNVPRQQLTPRLSSVSSSSTLNNLVPVSSRQDASNALSGAAQKEETVTKTIQTQQIQTTFHHIGQHLGDSAFFTPLPSSSAYHQSLENEDVKIPIPISNSTLGHDEQPAIQHF